MGAAPDEVVGLAARHRRATPSCASRRCGPTARWPTNPTNPFTDVQLDRFDAGVGRARPPRVWPRRCATRPTPRPAWTTRGSRYDLVRAGIGIYGLAPSPALADRVDLRPALTLRAEVAMVKRVPAGESISYGQAHTFARDANVATVPIGYADGVARRLSFTGGQVLIGGRRCPIVGAITMDQLMVDCGDDAGGRGRRGGAHRPPGRRGDHGPGVGRPARHHRLRDRVRHRAPGTPPLPAHRRPRPRGDGGGVGPAGRARSGGRSRQMRAVPSPGAHPARRARRRGQHLHPVRPGRGTHPGGVRGGRSRLPT